jgi:predicted dienelactone hydrolase
VLFVLEQLRELRNDDGEAIGRIIDSDKAAVTGFSLGGWTAVRAGATRAFDAVIAQAAGFSDELTSDAAKTSVPTMLMGGGADREIALSGLQDLFGSYPDGAPAYFLAIVDAIHSQFHDICFETECGSNVSRERVHYLVDRYATAFLMTYLSGDERYAAFLESALPDAELSYSGD